MEHPCVFSFPLESMYAFIAYVKGKEAWVPKLSKDLGGREDSMLPLGMLMKGRTYKLQVVETYIYICFMLKGKTIERGREDNDKVI